MTAYENDVLVIPERYKKMSVSELEREKEKMVKEISTAERPKKQVRKNSNIIFKF